MEEVEKKKKKKKKKRKKKQKKKRIGNKETSEPRSCVKVGVDVLGFPCLIPLWSLWT